MLGHYIKLKSLLNNNCLTISNDGKFSFDENDIKNSIPLNMRYIGKYITLQHKSGKFISSNANGGLELSDKNLVGENERFEIEWLNEDRFALKANNGFYISVQQDGKIELNQKNINLNEQFSMVEQSKESLFEFLHFV